MKVAVVKETYPGERRVGLVPNSVPLLLKAGMEVLVQAGAGEAAGFADQHYFDKGAKIAATRDEAFAADIIVQVRSLGANLKAGRDDLSRLRSGQVLLGMCDPLGEPKAVDEIAKTGATLFALELIPRTTRAQSMDVLSSMATIAGYRAVLLAAMELPKVFPMLMTAAGTLTAAKAFVIGAGVAGLQAIATAKRLGAIVRAYDVRPACREQVESVGGKFVELPLEAGDAQDKGGYAKAQGEEFYRKQRELMAKVVGESDVVITTAAIPGKASPLLVTAEAVAGMHVGSVIVDLAAERGGNCALTKADERVVAHGVTILGPTNLVSDAPTHASQMFSGNVTNLLQYIVKSGKLELSTDDEIIRETMATQKGQVVHPRILAALGTS
ncbi:MAG: Re/Si-specific NAD(P)(+) transhydrogenase subunit alpha [Planctomycetales bacterium]|nr:Re/Si-specific NAD(P)(+) transhydrogenase subunit alpha [Planctomycetales bacterium]